MILVSHNIYLSPTSLSDVDTLLACMQAKEISDNTVVIPFPYTRQDAVEWLEDNDIFREETGLYTTLAIRIKTGELIGVIGLHSNYVKGVDKTEFGYWLSKPYWNRGIMTGVIEKFCEVAPEQFGLKELEAYVLKFNLPSQKVLLNAGFTQNKTMPGWFKKDGQKLDAIRFSRLL